MSDEATTAVVSSDPPDAEGRVELAAAVDGSRSGWMGRIGVNPVLDRELRQRMRGLRAMLMLTAFLLLLTAVLSLAYAAQSSADSGFGNAFEDATRIARIGRTMFEWTVFFMLVLVVFFVPATSAGAVAGERDRQTLVPLQVTLLSPRAILFGKIGASMAFIALLIVAASPLLAIAYVVGGLNIGSVAAEVAMLLAVGTLLAAMTVACSTFANRVAGATLLAYGLTMALFIGTGIAATAAGVLVGNDGGRHDLAVAAMWPNPIVAVADVVESSSSDPFGDTPSPLGAVRAMLHPEELGESVFAEERAVLAADGPAPPFFEEEIPFDDPGVRRDNRPDWLYSLLSMTAIAAVLLVVAARRLRAPAKVIR